MTSGTVLDLVAVWGTGPNDVYAFGDSVFLHYNGTVWSALPAINASPLRVIWGTSGKDVFVSTRQGLFHFDGVRWSPVSTGLQTEIQAIAGGGDVTIMLDDIGNAIRLVRTISWSN